MKTAQSKTARILPFGAFLIAAFFATTAIIESCKFSIIDDPNGGSGGSKQTGTLTVQFQEKDSSRSAAAIARTVVPSIATNAGSYLVECVNAGGSTVASAHAVASLCRAFIQRPWCQGSITVRVKPTTRPSALIATGETTVPLPGGSTVPVTVQLQPVPQNRQTRRGTIALQIKWPTVSADTIDWYLDGILKQTLTASSTPNVVSDGTTSTVTLFATGTNERRPYTPHQFQRESRRHPARNRQRLRQHDEQSLG